MGSEVGGGGIKAQKAEPQPRYDVNAKRVLIAPRSLQVGRYAVSG